MARIASRARPALAARRAPNRDIAESSIFMVILSPCRKGSAQLGASCAPPALALTGQPCSGGSPTEPGQSASEGRSAKTGEPFGSALGSPICSGRSPTEPRHGRAQRVLREDRFLTILRFFSQNWQELEGSCQSPGQPQRASPGWGLHAGASVTGRSCCWHSSPASIPGLPPSWRRRRTGERRRPSPHCSRIAPRRWHLRSPGTCSKAYRPAT